VKGITGESFVPESLILAEGILALCDDTGLRTVILSTLSTLDESGVAVRQTGGRNPHRGIQISDAPDGGPQSAGVAPSASARASHASVAAPHPLDKGKGLQAAPPPQAALEYRRKRGGAGCVAPTDRLFRTPPLGSRRPAPRNVRGLLAGPRRPAPRPRVRRGASVLRHHNHQARHHHNRHHNRHHHHPGAISPRDTSSSSNNSSSKSSGRPASRVVGRSKAPSECNPFLPLIRLSCRRVLTLPLLVRASSPSVPKVVPSPPPAAAAEAAPSGP
jgi:hypothetical protein